MLAGRKVQRNLKGKWIASLVTVSIMTFGLIWLLLLSAESTRGTAGNAAA